jgi:hypothetical protein
MAGLTYLKAQRWLNMSRELLLDVVRRCMEMAGWRYEKHRYSWLGAENGLMYVEKSSETAGYELGMAFCTWERAQRLLATS